MADPIIELGWLIERGMDSLPAKTDAQEHLATIDEAITQLCTRVTQLTAALQALADAVDARLHDPNWMPLLNARRALAQA